MSRLINLILTNEQRAALEQGTRHGTSHAFRTRCRMILLKAARLPPAQVAEQVGYCMISVNGWVKSYPYGGIDGLKTNKAESAGPFLMTSSIWSRRGLLCRATDRDSSWSKLKLRRD